MPFIPHTKNDIDEMLSAINIVDIAELFDEIPDELKINELKNLAAGMNEREVTRFISEKEPNIAPGSCFIGAGAYEHHIPAAIWDIATRGEYYSAYTPYQAEASQGTLQLIYEYQTIMCQLLGLDISNASMYDGATALVESILMAVRIKKGKARRVVIPSTINPIQRKVLDTFLPRQNIIIEDLAFCSESGCLIPEALDSIDAKGLAAIVIPQPNFFGVLEDVDELVNRAKAIDTLTIAYVNPMAMSLLKEPGAWGDTGVDIACGEGQPLGIPLASGGPYFGFMCCRQQYVRQMPGRIVGRTNDEDGKEGFVLTLQAREQHIRRAKATSNICTNQGLMVTAATIYMSLLGAIGLRDVALSSHHNAMQLLKKLEAVDGVQSVFSGAKFHEFVIRLDKPVHVIIKAMSKAGIQAGLALEDDSPEFENYLLVCATETKTEDDLNNYVDTLQKVLKRL